MLQFYPDLAACLVLSMPHALLGTGGSHAQALDLIAARGVRFAGEGWADGGASGTQPSTIGLTFMKIAADRLLDRERVGPGARSSLSIAEQAAAAKLTLLATGVASDDDAMALLDLGVDLMSGPRFGDPRRLRPEGVELGRGLPARV
jgi:EAL domain-containing protein (putative c-di-GMP-specific phosphodiesterase class I)